MKMNHGWSNLSLHKFQRLAYLFEVHMRICARTMEKHRWPHRVYYAKDFYAGPGLYTAEHGIPELVGEFGSPLLIARSFDQVFRGKGVKLDLFLNDLHTADELQEIFWKRKVFPRAIIKPWECGEAVDFDIARTLPLIGRNRYGLAFFDPKGKPELDAIVRFAEYEPFAQIDILVNLSAATVKRGMDHPLSKDGRRPTDYLRAIGKKYIYLWRPHPSDPKQFTMALCTNWNGFPEFKKLGFHNIDSANGREIEYEIDHTNLEKGIQ